MLQLRDLRIKPLGFFEQLQSFPKERAISVTQFQFSDSLVRYSD